MQHARWKINSIYNFIKLNVSDRKEKKVTEKKKISSWIKYSPQTFVNNLEACDWGQNENPDDVDGMFEVIIDKLNKSLEGLVSEKIVNDNDSYKWFNSHLDALKMERNNAKFNYDSDKSEE